MSRRKDRDRYLAMKDLNPDYQGFRGYDLGPTPAENTQLEAVTCTVCGRRRNVAVEIAQEQGEKYVCLSCREAEEGEAQQQTIES